MQANRKAPVSVHQSTLLVTVQSETDRNSSRTRSIAHRTSYIFKVPIFLGSLTMLLISTVAPFATSSILDATLDMAMFWYSSARSAQVRLLMQLPQRQVTFTWCLQAVTGQGGLWHGRPQEWPQTGRDSRQGCVQGVAHFPKISKAIFGIQFIGFTNTKMEKLHLKVTYDVI